jgi:ABC-2 type transport system ATP-binding protein
VISSSSGIHVQDLHFAYAGRKSESEVLKGLGFVAPAGRITGILGPNGSGKSTTFKILSTQLSPSSGDAFMEGHSSVHERALVRSLLGVTFQSPSLDPLLTLEENLRIHAALVGVHGHQARTRIDELLRSFHLEARRKDLVKELSGGLARRVELAKSLLGRPSILLLDEPTTGLDPRARLEFWQELRNFSKEGMTLLVTTHLMDEAELCDRLVFITEGRVAGEGTPAEFKAQFGAELFTLELEGLENDEGLRWLETLLGGEKVRHVMAGRYRVETRHAQAVMAKLQPEMGSRVRGLQWGKPTLADVYFSKTGKSLA